MATQNEIIYKAVLDKSSLLKEVKELQKQVQKQLNKDTLNLYISLETKSAVKDVEKIDKVLSNNISKQTKKLSQWVDVGSITKKVFEEVGKSLTELKEVDNILTKISKNTDSISQKELKNLGSDAFDIAGKYSKKAADYLSAIQSMSRENYINSAELSELSLMTQSACDMTGSLANQFIIITDKAYRMNGSITSLTAALDGANNISKQNILDMNQLAEGISITGLQAADSGLKIEQTTSAVAAMIAATGQSGNVIGNAFNDILMFLQQMASASDNITIDSLSQYEKACADLGVSLKEVKDGVYTLRDPMEILKDLSQEYRTLNNTDIRKENLLQAVGGNERSEALDSLLKNWGLYEKMLGDYASGAGSIFEDAMKSAGSLEGSLNRLGNAWTGLVGSFADSDFLKTVLDSGTALINVIDTIIDQTGVLTPILTGVGISAFVKNFDWFCNKNYLKIA